MTTPKRTWETSRLLAGGGLGIHWPDVDEDLTTAVLLRGASAARPVDARASAFGSAPPLHRVAAQRATIRFGSCQGSTSILAGRSLMWSLNRRKFLAGAGATAATAATLAPT